MENTKTSNKKGRPAAEGKKRQYVIPDDVHEWIMSHGGSKYITETFRKKEHHFVLWIVFAITASFLHNKNVINGDIISKVQNMKGKRFGRTIQKISGKNNKR